MALPTFCQTVSLAPTALDPFKSSHILSNTRTWTVPRHLVATILAISGPDRRRCRDDMTLFLMPEGTSRETAAMAQCIIRTIWGSGVGGFRSTDAYLATCSSEALSASRLSETDMIGKRGMMRSRHVSYTAVHQKDCRYRNSQAVKTDSAPSSCINFVLAMLSEIKVGFSALVGSSSANPTSSPSCSRPPIEPRNSSCLSSITLNLSITSGR